MSVKRNDTPTPGVNWTLLGLVAIVAVVAVVAIIGPTSLKLTSGGEHGQKIEIQKPNPK